MKSKFIFPAGCLALGVAIGWTAKSVPSVGISGSTSDQGTTSASDSRTSGQATASETRMESHRVTRPASDRIVPAEGKVESMVKQAMNQMPDQAQMRKQMIEKEREKFESRFAKLTTELNLSSQQQAKIRAAIEKSLKEMANGEMKDLPELMKAGGLDEVTTATLNEEQKASFAAIKAKERQNRIDSKALKSLAVLTPVLDLNEEQKDAVYGVLSEQAAKQQDGERLSGSIGVPNSEGMSVRAMGDIELPDSILDHLMSPDDLKKQNDGKIAAMRPVLTEQQLQLYITHLEKPLSDNVIIMKTPPNPGK